MKTQILTFLLLSICCTLKSQNQLDTIPGKPLQVGFETRTFYYMSDSDAGITRPDDHFGTNNYLNLSYSFDKFTVGLQYEAYLPAAQGYGMWDGADITMKYVAFQDSTVHLVVGDFYEQFGSGLVFRAYENRLLGINTALQGVKGSYAYQNKALLRVVYGHPRYYNAIMDDSEVRGADISLNLNNITGWQSQHQLQVQGSFFNRYQMYSGSSTVPENVDAWSARLKYAYKGLRLSGEYVEKKEDILSLTQTLPHKGKAVLFEADYAAPRWDASLAFRRIERMYFASSRISNASADYADWLNYIPSLTRRHTYSLARMNPYRVCPEGEIGGRVDVRYYGDSLREAGSWYVHFNGAYFYRLNTTNSVINNQMKDPGFFDTAEKLYHDFSVDIHKQWNGDWQSSLFICNQSYNPLLQGYTSQEWVSNIWAVDVQRQISADKSLGIELQHLLLHEDSKSWLAAKVEYRVKKWQFSIADSYNYGNDADRHYYNAAVRYTTHDLYLDVNIGRHYSEYLMSEGMNRLIPAYTGLQCVLQKTF